MGEPEGFARFFFSSALVTMRPGGSPMKSRHTAFFVLLACLSFATIAIARDQPKPASVASSNNAGAQFDKLKDLAGEWISRSPEDPMSVTRYTYKVVSNGSALMLTTEVPNEGPMVTMFYLDGPRLMATHFCGEKNQPRYVAGNSTDPKTIVFKFKDATNLDAARDGYMSGVTFQFGDSDHHTQQWTLTEKGKTHTERFDLERSR
jgi:hypothetical protein